ncbi:hypothetical protein [Amycolatopsis tolypomycina]|nr:hypothetical protein [Amycolatopsis tolypomycina]
MTERTDWLDRRIDPKTVSEETVTSATPAHDDPMVVPGHMPEPPR